MTALDDSPVGVLEGLKIIDCDAHMTEPADLWTARVPASYRDRVPRQQTVDGVTAWYLDDGVWATVGGNTIRTGGQKVIGEHIVQPFSEVDPAAWDASARVRLLDEMGVYAQIAYPNAVGFSSNHIWAIEDHDLRNLVLRTYNDWFVDVQEESGGRLLGQGLLPTWDMELTIKEMERLLAKGMRGFTVSDKPELLGLPELPDPYFAPMWALANESGAVINFHIGSGGRREISKDQKEAQETLRRQAETSKQYADLYWSSFGPQRRLAILSTQMYMSNVRIIVNLCMSDLFDRYPNVKIVSAESGIGWVPFILEAMEYQIDEMVTDPAERSLQKLRPSEYFRNHIYVTFWFEHVGPSKLIEDIGVDNVLIETDIPHPTCLYPGAKEHLARVLSGLDPHVRRRVLQDNAAELYRVGV
jgi:predicted TIM-barrel fold metal-dependent hydrolase